MTNQELFDKALNGIREQGSLGTQCVPFDGEKYCAIGCVFKEAARKNIGKYGNDAFWSAVHANTKGRLYLSIYEAHDSSQNVGEFETKMAKIVESYGLEYVAP